MSVTINVLEKVTLITVVVISNGHTELTSKHGDDEVLHRPALIVAVVLISVVTLWIEGAAGPLAQMIEQNLVALSLVLLIPLLTPWLK